LIYIGTGNAGPYKVVNFKDDGAHDELYAASIIAIHADSGQMAWHYQEVPGDAWDYDTCQKMVLADIDIAGRTRKVLMQASKNGFLYTLDRASGEFISAAPFAYVNWTKGLDPTTHRPIPTSAADWTHEPRLLFPGAQGAHNWQPMSYSPKTGLVYIPAIEGPMVYINAADKRAGLMEFNFELAFIYPEDYDPAALAGLFGKLPPLDTLARGIPTPPKSRGLLRAYDPVQQKVVWEGSGSSIWDGGVLSTAGGLVFRGDAAGMLNVYSADGGQLLKQIDVGTSMMAAPMTYRINGEQYVAVMAGYGGGLLFEAFPAGSAPLKYGNGRIIGFKLGGGDVPKPTALPESPPVELPPREGNAKQIAAGEVLYNRYCARCHVFGVGLLPDLRRMNPGTHSVFYEIVLHGAYQAKGMARWDDVLSHEDAEAIHAYQTAKIQS
jgi:quinohemoprotein ethanol dehydrogenase